MERMRQADGDIERKTRCQTTSVNSISSLLAAFSSVILGEDSLLDDLDAAGDDLALVVDTLNSNDDDLHGHPSSQLPRGDCRPLSVWRNRLRVISYITRDEVSTAKET